MTAGAFVGPFILGLIAGGGLMWMVFAHHFMPAQIDPDEIRARFEQEADLADWHARLRERQRR